MHDGSLANRLEEGITTVRTRIKEFEKKLMDLQTESIQLRKDLYAIRKTLAAIEQEKPRSVTPLLNAASTKHAD